MKEEEEEEMAVVEEKVELCEKKNEPTVLQKIEIEYTMVPRSILFRKLRSQ